MQISLLRMPSLLALGFYNILLKEMASRNDIAISYSSNNNLHAAYLHVEGVAFSKPSLICLLIKDNIFGFNYGEEEGVSTTGPAFMIGSRGYSFSKIFQRS